MRRDDTKSRTLVDPRNTDRTLITEILPHRKKDDPTSLAIAELATDITHINFNLPDGSTYAHDFKSNICLQEVVEYVQNNLNLRFNSFNLKSGNRELTAEDRQHNLVDLNLVPAGNISLSPALTVIKEVDSARSQNSETVTTHHFFLISFIIAIFSFFARLFSSSPEQAPLPELVILPVEEIREPEIIPVMKSDSDLNSTVNKKAAKKSSKHKKFREGDEASDKSSGSNSTGTGAKLTKSAKSLLRLKSKEKKQSNVHIVEP